MGLFRPKLIDTLKDYNREQFFKDVIAGVIVGVVALPLAIAFAIASGVSPEKGIFTAIIAGFISTGSELDGRIGGSLDVSIGVAVGMSTTRSVVAGASGVVVASTLCIDVELSPTTLAAGGSVVDVVSTTVSRWSRARLALIVQSHKS